MSARSRAARPLSAKLGSVVLGFEALIVFLGGLAVYGLRALPDDLAPWWGIVGGAVVALLMVLVSGVVHTRFGVIAGWSLQAVVAASAVLVPAMLIITLVFGGMWAFAMIQGPRIEARATQAHAEGE